MALSYLKWWPWSRNERNTSNIHTSTLRRAYSQTRRHVTVFLDPADGHNTGRHLLAATLHGQRQSESFKGEHTSVCLLSPCFCCGWCGWWLELSGRRSSFCWRNGMNVTSGRGWFETGQRCGRTASGRRSGPRAPAQTHMVDLL